MFALHGHTVEYESFLKEWNDTRPYIVTHTSGSTGLPKEIRLSKTDMIQSARSTIDFFSLNADSVLYCPLSCGYIAGKMMLVRALEADCALYCEQPSNNVFAQWQGDPEKVDLLAVVPSQTDSFFDRALPPIANVIIGGAPLTALNEQRLLKEAVAGFVTYGMTETASHVALRRLGSSCYRALPGIRFEADGQGRLIIKSDIREFGTLLTNDVVELLDATSFRWIGRFDNVVNSGGVKLHIEELEKRLSEQLAFNFFLTSRASRKWGEELVMVVEGTDSESLRNEVAQALETALQPCERPKDIIVLAALPVLGNGKVNRHAF